jgi:hypothetical protein
MISAPSPLGLWPGGVQDLGRRLLDNGLEERLPARVAAEVTPRAYVREKDPATGYLNGPKVKAMALEVAEIVAAEWATGRLALILGETVRHARRGRCAAVKG